MIEFFFVFAHVMAQTSNPDLPLLISRQEAQIQRTVLFALIPVVVAFSFIVFVFYRVKRESAIKEQEAQFRVSLLESELKALRAQINPHFIFNCLNSIHHYMLSNNLPQAGEYLIKFSQLVRHVLETSSQRMVLLSDELEAVRNYAQLEQVRTHNSFSFYLHVTPEIGADIYVPPMLIQPLIENAIWHGVGNATVNGNISVSLAKHDSDHIMVLIEDNGSQPFIKAKEDLSYKVKKTSKGLKLIEDRLETLNQVYSRQIGLTKEEILDDKNCKMGTRVKLILPFED